MDRRQFLQNIAVTTAASPCFSTTGQRSDQPGETVDPVKVIDTRLMGKKPDIAGQTLVCEFKIDSTDWKVYEDLRSRGGSIAFLSSQGSRVLPKSDVEARDKFIVQTWHRTARIENSKVVKAAFGYSYPAFPPGRGDPKAEEFYRALLIFAGYWEHWLHDCAPASLPQNVWIDMSKHAFAKELMVRPGGVYPQYGAVDRDDYGSEYDGPQDIFTSCLYQSRVGTC